ncbi:MAG: hypothetical protein KC418_24075, partial [Anaerolineales bacterium]|nr:hypothetical protein [Anaerolineales bacterium]
TGTATDSDGIITAENFSWNVTFLHEGHVHPVEGPINGVTTASFIVPYDGHSFFDYTAFRIELTVTDADGIATQESVIIDPDKVNITLATDPPGLILTLDNEVLPSPFTRDTLIGFEHRITADATQLVDNTLYEFAGWSDGGDMSHYIYAPITDTTYTAVYQVATCNDVLAGTV